MHNWHTGHGEVCGWLLDQGVPADEQMHDGTTALHLACWRGHVSTCRQLLDKGAQLLLVNKHGCHCMHWVAAGGAVDAAQFLIGAAADRGHEEAVWVRFNGNGSSPLHMAARKNRRAMCEFLLGRSEWSRALHADNDGNRPSAVARIEGHVDLSAFLAEHEARVGL